MYPASGQPEASLILCVVSDAGAGKPRPHDPVPPTPHLARDMHTQERGPCRPAPRHGCTFPGLVGCTFRERPAGGAGVEEKGRGTRGALRPEEAGTAEEGMCGEGPGVRRGTGCAAQAGGGRDRGGRDVRRQGGRGVQRGTGCAEGDGVCDSGPRTPLPSGAADHAHTQGDPRRLHSASPGGAATSTGQRPRGGRNNPEKPAPRACRGRRLDRTHLSLTCTRPSSSCPACPARSAPSSGSAACATACCRRSSICFLSGSTVSWSFAENGCACEERPHR